MARTGPKRKPAEISKRDGNPGNRPIPEIVLVGSRELAPPPAPDDLPAEGVDLWNTLIAEIYAVGLAQTVDFPALETLCFQYGVAKKARKVVFAEGHYALGSQGQVVEHPALAIEARASALLLRFLTEYGLTASSRASMGLAGLQAKKLHDELADKLGGLSLTPGDGA